MIPQFSKSCKRMGNYLCGVERSKRFVKVHLHCIVRNLKKDKRNVDVALPWKISVDAHDLYVGPD